MLREIIRPQSEIYSLRIPKEYLNQDVEILVLPFSYPKTEESSTKSDIVKATAGLLKDKNIDPVKWQNEIREEWDDR
ncbi:MAG: hypothetical protein HQM10_07845 [Candidatus Riflebacteria bacterium]|nr:hypothetical protein [Candidatus Riflebacteria bacterium]